MAASSTPPDAPRLPSRLPQGWRPFPFQRDVWRAYLAGRSGLVHSSTGTGKTLAVSVGPLIEHQHAPAAVQAVPGLRVLWITPLRALAQDTVTALRDAAATFAPGWTVLDRTGDSSSATRAQIKRQMPHALVTTPESAWVLLSQPEHQHAFDGLQLVVVDEWHELLGTKRGVMTELLLARLRALCPAFRCWGLSATLGDLQIAMATLLGPHAASGVLVEGRVNKRIEIRSVLPAPSVRFAWGGHLGLQLLNPVLDAIDTVPSTLVFTNTRSQAEYWFQAMLAARPGLRDQIGLHHGSLDAAARAEVESGLKTGTLRAVVATSSLDLGVDFAPVAQVIQIASPKGVARLLQRAGRSGHAPGATSRILCVPTNTLEIVEIAAARDLLRTGRIESKYPIERPLDLLCQHMLTVAAGAPFDEAELFAEVTSTQAYRALTREEWAWCLDFAAHGGKTLGAYREFRRLERRGALWHVTDARTAARHRLSIGTITADPAVDVQFVSGRRLGSVEESFAARLRPGDKFVFAGKTLEFVRMRDVSIHVKRATGTGLVPRWMGGNLPLSSELAEGVRARLDAARLGTFRGREMLRVRPVLEIQARLSRIPARNELLVEQFATRWGHHLIAFPFAGRLVNQGVAALFAFRLGRVAPNTFTFSANDHAFELLAAQPFQLDPALFHELCSEDHLFDDILGSLNASELARRQFREIARIAGLTFQGFPGRKRSNRQIQASSGLLYDVFERYDSDNLLLRQARHEVLERQLERSRLLATLRHMRGQALCLVATDGPSPLAYPVFVERLREHASTEHLADQVRRMEARFESLTRDGPALAR